MRAVSQLVSLSPSFLARTVGLVLLTAGAAACSSDDGDERDPPAIDPEAPVVTITSPSRGAYVGDVSQVTISGKVSDDSQLRSVTINDTPITLDAAGNFSAVVPMSPTGTSLYHVVATDLEGRSAR